MILETLTELEDEYKEACEQRKTGNLSWIKAEFVDLTKIHRPVNLEIHFPKALLQLSLCHQRLEWVRPTVGN